MLQYSKIYGLLTNKNSQKGAANFGLNCTVHESYSRNGILRYVYFETASQTPCLLYINPDTFQVTNDVAKKFTDMTRWEKPEISLDTIITTDQNIPLIPEIKTTSSPEVFVNLLTTLLPSTKSIPYKIGISLEEYLLTQVGDDIDVFCVRGNREPKLLIVVDLTTLLNDASTEYIERVYLAVNKVLTDSCEQFWTNLNSLLIKCQKVKIITNGRKKNFTPAGGESAANLLVKMAKLQSSHNAIKTALQSLDF